MRYALKLAQQTVQIIDRPVNCSCTQSEMQFTKIEYQLHQSTAMFNIFLACVMFRIESLK